MKSLALLSLLLATGCLEVPLGPGQECIENSDCNSAAGEVCQEGVCWGNPPVGMFAATVLAPSTREDLVSTEIPLLSLSPDGWLGELGLESPVRISGRVEAYCATSTNCTNLSIAATIRVTRTSRFAGGPAFTAVTESKADLPRGMDSFSIALPRTRDGDPAYVVTIDPLGGGPSPPSHGGTDPAQLVPPRQLTLVADIDLEHQTYVVGGAEPTIISGGLKDPVGNYLTKYRVVALGRFQGSSVRTEVSTVHYSTNGQYSITLADGIVGQIELVAKSYDPQVVAPELHVTNLEALPQTKIMAQPTGLGARASFAVTLQGLSGDGEVKPVSGARVIVSGVHKGAFIGAADAVFEDEFTTGDDGVARLSLLDGATLRTSYRLRVLPPPSSNLGVIYNADIALEQAGVVVRLPSRVALRGTVVDVFGKPLGDVSVTARRSQRFLWSLQVQDQAFLDEIPAATTITPETGDFLLWVDPALADAWGHYDLNFETPINSHAPNWTIADFEIPRIPDQTTIPLDIVTIPDAAYLHGKIIDPDGAAVEDSALRIFQLAPDNLLCMQVGHAPSDCAAEAKVLGHGESDTKGIVRLTLPRP